MGTNKLRGVCVIPNKLDNPGVIGPFNNAPGVDKPGTKLLPNPKLVKPPGVNPSLIFDSFGVNPVFRMPDMNWLKL